MLPLVPLLGLKYPCSGKGCIRDVLYRLTQDWKMSLPSTVDVSRASSGRDERDVGDACVLDTSNVQSTRRCKASFNMLVLTAGPAMTSRERPLLAGYMFGIYQVHLLNLPAV